MVVGAPVDCVIGGVATVTMVGVIFIDAKVPLRQPVVLQQPTEQLV